MFYLGGVGLAFFLAFLLLSKKGKTVADKILAGWLFIITAHLLLFYFNKMELYPYVLGVGIPFPLLHGPFLYMYTLALTNRLQTPGWYFLHVAPFTVAFIYLIDFFFLPVEQKVYVFQNKGVGYETFNTIMLWSIIASGVVYVFLSSVLLKKHRQSIADQFSSTENINLVWLQYLIYWIGIIWLLVIFGNDDLVFGAAVLFIGFIGFFGIRQVGIFHSPMNVSNTPEDPTNTPQTITTTEEFPVTIQEKRKYQKSGLSTDGSEMLHTQLVVLMRDEKPYRESELSLAELAERLNTQPNYLSQVINEREEKNFYDFINTLRIEEFKRLVAVPESRKYTLLALAQQCGFNSKSSFNRYFKKVTGQSPSEFMQEATVSEK